jgi:hypothetical protein
MNYIEEVFNVYGENLPAKHIYTATKKSPVLTIYILKQYKTWAKFKIAYNKYAIEQRNKKVKEDVIVKKVSKKETKNVFE